MDKCKLIEAQIKTLEHKLSSIIAIGPVTNEGRKLLHELSLSCNTAGKAVSDLYFSILSTTNNPSTAGLTAKYDQLSEQLASIAGRVDLLSNASPLASTAYDENDLMITIKTEPTSSKNQGNNHPRALDYYDSDIEYIGPVAPPIIELDDNDDGEVPANDGMASEATLPPTANLDISKTAAPTAYGPTPPNLVNNVQGGSTCGAIQKHTISPIQNNAAPSTSVTTQATYTTKVLPQPTGLVQKIVPTKIFCCPICLTEPMVNPTSTFCGHIFCNKCINDSLKIKKKCPICNKVVAMTKMHRIFLNI